MDKTDISWGIVLKGRLKARELFSLRKIPLVPNIDRIIKDYIDKNAKILDVGAGTRRLKRCLDKIGYAGIYKSMDLDDFIPHDYRSFDEITDKFDCVILLEVIEHNKPKDVLELFKNIYEVLNPDGKILISTPNVNHPTRFWRDCTHITPFRYDEVAGFLISCGYKNIKIFRVRKLKISQKILVFLYRPLLKLLDMDIAPGLVIIAEK